jgi:hypothetical protein
MDDVRRRCIEAARQALLPKLDLRVEELTLGALGQVVDAVLAATRDGGSREPPSDHAEFEDLDPIAAEAYSQWLADRKRRPAPTPAVEEARLAETIWNEMRAEADAVARSTGDGGWAYLMHWTGAERAARAVRALLTQTREEQTVLDALRQKNNGPMIREAFNKLAAPPEEARPDFLAWLSAEATALDLAHYVDDIVPQDTHTMDQQVARHILSAIRSMWGRALAHPDTGGAVTKYPTEPTPAVRYFEHARDDLERGLLSDSARRLDRAVWHAATEAFRLLRTALAPIDQQ